MMKGRSFLRNLLVTVNALVAAAILLSYCAGVVNPARFWIFSFFGLAYPYLLIINIVFVLFWLILWKKYLFISLLCILAGWNSLRALYPFRFKDPHSTAGPVIRIVSYNVHSLYGKQREGHFSETKSKVTDFLASRNSDIICIQEFYSIGEDFTQTLDKFTKSIRLEYFYFKNYQEFVNKRKINAIATFSRYPIVGTGNFKLRDHSHFAIFTDIVVNRDTIRIYNLHLESIRFGDEDYSFYSHLTEPDMEKTSISTGSKRMLWKLRKAFILRSSEVNTLKKHIASCRYPVIIAGDFNDTPSSYSYHQLTDGMYDSFKAAGSGFFESTYAGKLPSFRIDYILYSGKFEAVEYRKFNIGLSDHYPITSTLLIHP